MSLLNKGHQPSQTDYMILAAVLMIFGLIVAGLVYLFAKSVTAAITILVVTALITAIYLALPPVRPLVYAGWMALFYPVGWFISHALLAITFYLVLTPIGVVMRLAGYDPMRKKLDVQRGSNWSSSSGDHEARRYFQQF